MNISPKALIAGLAVSLIVSSAVVADPYAADRQALKDSAQAASTENGATISTRNAASVSADETLRGIGGR